MLSRIVNYYETMSSTMFLQFVGPVVSELAPVKIYCLFKRFPTRKKQNGLTRSLIRRIKLYTLFHSYDRGDSEQYFGFGRVI